MANIERQRIVSMMRDLANALERGDTRMGVALAFIKGDKIEATESGHFISHINAQPLQRTLLRGQFERLSDLDGELERQYAKTISSEVPPTGSAGRLLN